MQRAKLNPPHLAYYFDIELGSITLTKEFPEPSLLTWAGLEKVQVSTVPRGLFGLFDLLFTHRTTSHFQ